LQFSAEVSITTEVKAMTWFINTWAMTNTFHFIKININNSSSLGNTVKPVHCVQYYVLLTSMNLKSTNISVI